MTDLRAVLLNCTLKPNGSSSTDVLLQEVRGHLVEHGVEAPAPIRVAALEIRPGVTSDEGDGDQWPDLRRQILDADLFVLGTPIWLGQPSSVAKRVLERLDAFLGERDDRGRMVSHDRVAMVAVVGNEDGAHHVCAEVFQALNDVGFTIPANGCTYWVGEAMHRTDYQELDERPKETQEATKGAVAAAVHLAGVLKAAPYAA